MKREKWIKSSLWTAATLAFFLTWIAPSAWCADKWPPIRTTTGAVTSIDRGSVVVLDGFTEFRPSPEALTAYPSGRRGIPEWIKVDSRVRISYYEAGGKRFFLDIVTPGEPLVIKEGVEEDRRTRSPQ